jgi:hypothetical protein
MVTDAVVAPLTVGDDGLTEQPKLAAEGKQFSVSVALPPFGPPRSSGIDAL